jgi:hypothetical protein
VIEANPFAKELREALSWALDILDMCDERLVQLGDPKEKVYSAVHIAAKAKARATLGGVRQMIHRQTGRVREWGKLTTEEQANPDWNTLPEHAFYKAKEIPKP